jgi:hypothetical protein
MKRISSTRHVWPLLVIIYLILALLFGSKYLSPASSSRPQSSPANSEGASLSNDYGSLSAEQAHDLRSHCRAHVKPLFDRLIFIVIDAFRADFVPHLRSHLNLNSQIKYELPFVDDLILRGSAVTAVAQARTPTVTTPRLKALLSGSQSNFIDLLINLNAKHLQKDNLVSRAHSVGRRLVFYGDDTWLQLFDADIFLRHNKTDSFFATDYTSVDTNVTENLLPEMHRATDWDFAFAHYLGVDHIGHSWGGALSGLMQPKLNEMDDVVHTILDTVTQKYGDLDFLVVLVGDHGMTEVGNHGGNTDQETHTAALFLSSALHSSQKAGLRTEEAPFKPEFIQQTDISVLLSALLGLSIPAHSEGRLNDRLFDRLTRHKPHALQVKLCYQLQNSQVLAEQQPQVAAEFAHLFAKATNAHLQFIEEEKTISHAHRAVTFYDYFLHKMQSIHSDGQSEHLDLTSLKGCTLIQCLIVCWFFRNTYNSLLNSAQIVTSTVSSFAKLLNYFLESCTVISAFCIASFFLQAVLLTSTSFIENEHHYSMLFACTVLLLWLRTLPHISITNPKSIQLFALIMIVNHWSIEDRPSIITFFNLRQSIFILPLLSLLSIVAVIPHLFDFSRIQLSFLIDICFIVSIIAYK